jgi:hypothetical protein
MQRAGGGCQLHGGHHHQAGGTADPRLIAPSGDGQYGRGIRHGINYDCDLSVFRTISQYCQTWGPLAVKVNYHVTVAAAFAIDFLKNILVGNATFLFHIQY